MRNGKIMKGSMPAKHLSPMERMTLTAGNIMKVVVTGEDESGYTLGLPTASKPTTPSIGTKLPSHSIRPGKIEPYQAHTYTRNSARQNTMQDNPKINANPFQTHGNSQLTDKPPGILLNNLKTGMNLEAVVKNTTPYGAFVETNAYRLASGGVYTKAVALLHKSDMLPEVLEGWVDQSTNIPIPVGTKLYVFVKQCFKQST
jgi:hypothetical protein